MDITKDVVAQRIKKLLESRGLSQSDFAEKSSMTKDAVSKIVNGKMALSVPSALKIANTFGVSLDYLFGLTEFENGAHYAYSVLKRHLRFTTTDPSCDITKYPSLMVSAPVLRYWDAIFKTKTVDLPDDLKNDWLARTENELIAAFQSENATDSETFILKPVSEFKSGKDADKS